MPFEIVRNDITNMHVDAIVNTANPRPVIGAGTDSRIHEVAGVELLVARQRIGSIEAGHAAITPAFQLNAKYVIHTVGPVWIDGDHDEEMLLRSCYENSLQLALDHNCESIAFPLISTGTYGFPKDKALQIAIAAFSSFLLNHEMQIYLVVFDRTAFQLSEKLFQKVASYIDQNYVDAQEMATYGFGNRRAIRRMRRSKEEELREYSMALEEIRSCTPQAPSKAMSLEDMLKQTDAGFAERLLELIDKTGKKDSEIYNRANVSRQHFSKIRNNPDYRPTKPTALAFAVALELDLEQTKDLIGRAGYALTNSSKFDVIVRFFIESGNYNMIDINTALFEFDQALLGSQAS